MVNKEKFVAHEGNLILKQLTFLLSFSHFAILQSIEKL